MKSFLAWFACLSVAMILYFTYPCIREAFIVGGLPLMAYVFVLICSIGIVAIMNRRDQK
jgi:hypothetical protein